MPYKRLYENCSEYITKHMKWINAKIGTYDPELIDQEVTVYYRNIMKLEQSFINNPAPSSIANTVALQFYIL